jgi:hypothetical protein
MVCGILAHKKAKKSGSSRSFFMLDTFHARQSAGGAGNSKLHILRAAFFGSLWNELR